MGSQQVYWECHHFCFWALTSQLHSDALSGRACPTVLMKLQWFTPFEGCDFSDNVTLSPPIPERDLGTHFAMAAPKETSHHQHSSLHRASSPHPDPPSPSTSTHLIARAPFKDFLSEGPTRCQKEQSGSLRMVIKEREPSQGWWWEE